MSWRAQVRTVGRIVVVGVLAVALSVVGLAGASSAVANPAVPGAPSSSSDPARPHPGPPVTPTGPPPSRGHRHAPVCGTPLPGHAACLAVVDLDVAGALTTSSLTPSGYAPADLQAAYGLPSSPAGAGRTVAIVDAFDLPTAQADLNTYRAQYGLPPCGAGCFTKVNQDGGSVLPAADASWGQEIALDMDMVSAACPSCKILLVEASSTDSGHEKLPGDGQIAARWRT